MSVETFALGQRWISSTEAELGLGIVSGVEGRRVTLSFPSAAESRTYATDNAPLSRFAHVPGEMLSTADDRRLSVIDLKAREGRIIYVAADANGDHSEVDELALSSAISLRTPEERLFAGQIDKSGLFDLRTRTLEHLQRLQSSPVRGLLGPRIQLLPHQLYIANEIGTRHAPRVLLADEVGLGKTIESGLVIHQQLVTGRASRVLVAVPDNLVHQWLVEMLRRFNLAFTLMDRDRYDALFDAAFASDTGGDLADVSDDGGIDNPFATAQLVLCSLSLLTDDPVVHAQACDAGFDLLVVDEAHHLRWGPGEPSDAYAAVEALASDIPGVLLLTGTPEQLGLEGHFARLRLLDPARYFSLEHFIEEEQGFEPVSELVQALLAEDANDQLALLAPRVAEFLGDEAASALRKADGDKQSRAAREDAAGKLLDRHGTGRVLVRHNGRGRLLPGRIRIVGRNQHSFRRVPHIHARFRRRHHGHHIRLRSGGRRLRINQRDHVIFQGGCRLRFRIRDQNHRVRHLGRRSRARRRARFRCGLFRRVFHRVFRCLFCRLFRRVFHCVVHWRGRHRRRHRHFGRIVLRQPHGQRQSPSAQGRDHHTQTAPARNPRAMPVLPTARIVSRHARPASHVRHARASAALDAAITACACIPRPGPCPPAQETPAPLQPPSTNP